MEKVNNLKNWSLIGLLRPLFCYTTQDSNSSDIMHKLCKYYGESDSGSTDDDDVDQGTETEDELDE
jgi:hypothetical protein